MENFTYLFEDAEFWEVLANTLKIVGGATIIATLAGYPADLRHSRRAAVSRGDLSGVGGALDRDRDSLGLAFQP
jgi:ABC-type spermidine/putrescine transport system permease subunit II